MGRNPKSAAEKAITGAGHRPTEDPKPQAPTGSAARSFAPPTWLLRKDARDVWHRVVPELTRLNIMTEGFRDVIGRYCTHFADWVKATQQINRQGMTMMVKMTNSEAKMPRLNPAIRVRDTIEKALIDIEDRFGLSPIARYRIITHQAARPGQRDLFGETPAPVPHDGETPIPPPAPRSSPIGALLN